MFSFAPRFERWTRRLLRSLFTGGVALLTAHSSFGEEPDERPAFRDLRHTVQARTAMLQDPELAPLNLGVTVRDGVATLWGPVPSVDLAFRAEVRLRAISELSKVVNELFVTEEFRDRGEPRLVVPPSPLPQPDLLPPALPTPPTLEAPIPLAPDRRPKLPIRNEYPQSAGGGGPASTSLYSPLVIGLSAPGLPLSPPLTAEDADLVRRLTKFQLETGRYFPVRFKVERSVVTLEAGDGKIEPLQEFAREVARWPGVERVVVKEPNSPR